MRKSTKTYIVYRCAPLLFYLMVEYPNIVERSQCNDNWYWALHTQEREFVTALGRILRDTLRELRESGALAS